MTRDDIQKWQAKQIRDTAFEWCPCGGASGNIVELHVPEEGGRP